MKPSINREQFLELKTAIQLHGYDRGNRARNFRCGRISEQLKRCGRSGRDHNKGIARTRAYFPSVQLRDFFDEMRGAGKLQRKAGMADLFSPESRQAQ